MTALNTSPTTSGTAPATPGRAARVGLVVLQVLLAAIYVFSASGKVTLDPTVVAGFAVMGFGPGMTIVIGVLELLGAIGLLIPRLSGVAAWALVALMVGATISTVIFIGGAMIAMPAVVLVLVGIVAWSRRHEAVALVREVRGLVAGR